MKLFLNIFDKSIGRAVIALSIFFIFLISACDISAQENSGKINGLVLDAETNEVIGEANITITDFESKKIIKAVSDLKGVFKIEQINTGTYTINDHEVS